MRCLLVICVLLTGAWCLPSDTYRTEFNAFKEHFHRVYVNEIEEVYRFKVFSENLDKILEHNQKYERGEKSFKLGITMFADMTHEEYLKFLEEQGGHRHFEIDPTPEEYKEEFFRFKEKYHKTYPNKEEEKLRFEIFKKNYNKIMEHNQLYEQGLSSYKTGVNNFTDFTQEEFLKWLEEQGGGHWTTVLPPTEVPSGEYKTEFLKFKEEYHKSYPTEEEEKHRFEIFVENFDKILEHNELYKRGLSSYEEGVTNFTDFTEEEFLKWLEEQGGGHWTTVSLPVGVPSGQYETQFLKFKEEYHKTYPTEEEEKHRFEIFVENFDKILEHNELYKRGLSSYEEGVTNFTDFTEKEFLKWLEEQGGGHWTTVLPPVVGSSGEYKTEFLKFKEKYHKNYHTEEEEKHRFAIFVENYDKILEHNEFYEQGLSSFKEGVTNFTDFTQEEFLKWLEEQGGGHWTTVLPPQSYLDEFEKFKLKYDKSYANRTEESYRLDIFLENLDEIVKHNEKYERGTESYRKTVTMFTDMTREEFLKWLEEHGGGRPPWAPTTEPLVTIEN